MNTQPQTNHSTAVGGFPPLHGTPGATVGPLWTTAHQNVATGIHTYAPSATGTADVWTVQLHDTASGKRMPLTKIDHRAIVDPVGLTAQVVLTYEFITDTPAPAELRYVLSIPPTATVHAATAKFSDTVLTTNLVERATARLAYETATTAGHRATLVEAERSDVFSFTLGRVAPSEKVQVSITCDLDVTVDGHEASIHVPLTVAPRYMPSGDSSSGGRVHTPYAIAPGPEATVVFEFEADPQNVRCDSHDTAIASARTVTVRQTAPDRDVVVRWDVPDSFLHAIWQADSDGTGGTLLVEVLSERTTKRRPLDVAILLDRSGSMGGWKMVAARRAASRLASALDATDTLWACGFDHQVDIAPLCDGGAQAADGLTRAHVASWLGALEAAGGTEMARPLRIAAAALGDKVKGRDRVLVFITDGQATNEAELAAIRANDLDGVKVITVGIDAAPAAGLLVRLAGNPDSCSMVDRPERLDEVLHRVVRKVATSAIRNLRIRSADAVEPCGSPAVDAHPGSLRRLYFRTGPTMPAGVAVVGDGGYRKEIVTRAAAPSCSGQIRRSWARERLRVLEDAWTVSGDDSHRVAMIATSIEHGVLCTQTALIAVDQSGAVVSGEMGHVDQPHAYPHGWASTYGANASASSSTFAGSYSPSDNLPARGTGVFGSISNTVAPLGRRMSDAAPLVAAMISPAYMAIDMVLEPSPLETSRAFAASGRCMTLAKSLGWSWDELWELIDDLRLTTVDSSLFSALIDAADDGDEQSCRELLERLSHPASVRA